MSEYILIGVVVYLWLVGGVFLTIGVADANFSNVKRSRIAGLIFLWPLICFYAAVVVTKDDVATRVRKWRAR